MNRKTIYVSDLDGTLLDDEAQLSQTTRTAIERLVSQAVPITIATARSIQSVIPIMDGIRLDLPIVTFNGAVLSDLRTGHPVLVIDIPNDSAGKIIETAEESSLVPFVSTIGGAAEHLYYQAIDNEGMRHYRDDRLAARDPRLQQPVEIRAALTERVITLTFIDRLDRLVPLADQLSDMGESMSIFENRYSPGWFWLTICASLAEKGRMVRTLMATEEISEHRLVAFGDEMNDAGLFETADHAVAVGNAVPGIRSIADEVIGDNANNSVARYILADALGE